MFLDREGALDGWCAGADGRAGVPCWASLAPRVSRKEAEASTGTGAGSPGWCTKRVRVTDGRSAEVGEFLLRAGVAGDVNI